MPGERVDIFLLVGAQQRNFVAEETLKMIMMMRESSDLIYSKSCLIVLEASLQLAQPLPLRKLGKSVIILTMMALVWKSRP